MNVNITKINMHLYVNNYTCFTCIHIIELIKRRHATCLLHAWLYAYKLYNTIISTYFYDQNYYISAGNIDHKIIQMANCLL